MKRVLFSASGLMAYATFLVACGGPLTTRDDGRGLSDGLVPDRTVYPTGVFPTDVLIVQAALDAGGTVLLKATDATGAPAAFNFGPAVAQRAGVGNVAFHTDATILGETVDGAMTTIRGGFAPVRSAVHVRSSVKGIHFEGPFAVAISIGASTGTEISGNLITDVVGWAYRGGYTWGWGIDGGSQALGGTLLIADNTIANVHAQIGYGIVFSGQSADTTITQNSVSGVNWIGILAGFYSAPVSIDHNVIVPGPAQDLSTTMGVGILFGHTRGAPAYVGRNTVLCENPYADGIDVVGMGAYPYPESDAIIEHNDITVHSPFGAGIGLWDQASSNWVRANKISGEGLYAFEVANGFGGYTADSNTFIGNDISLFQSSAADIFLDTNSQSTVVKGKSGVVIDLGVNDSVSGMTHGPMDSRLGDRMKQAHAVKHQITSVVPDYDGDTVPQPSD